METMQTPGYNILWQADPPNSLELFDYYCIMARIFLFSIIKVLFGNIEFTYKNL